MISSNFGAKTESWNSNHIGASILIWDKTPHSHSFKSFGDFRKSSETMIFIVGLNNHNNRKFLTAMPFLWIFHYYIPFQPMNTEGIPHSVRKDETLTPIQLFMWYGTIRIVVHSCVNSFIRILYSSQMHSITLSFLCVVE